MKTWSPESMQPNAATGTRPFHQQTMLRSGDMSRVPRVVVAIPVCNESARIVGCIDALAATFAHCPDAGVVLLVNNSTDASARKAHHALSERAMAGIVLDVTLLPEMATAGWARRLALDVAECWAHRDAVLMTTDADGRVAPDWAEANLALLADGAHLVCGRFTPDDQEAALIPARTVRSYALEDAYTTLSIELDSLLDPRVHDPWPHHGLASGASLAMTARDYCAIGRLPPVPCSEDRALAALVERHDLCVRHSDAPMVTVSCRLDGRARGGMADAIAGRIADPDSLADQRLLPAAITARRAILRKALRTVWLEHGDMRGCMRQLGLSDAQIARAGHAKTFGAIWAEIEAGAADLAACRMRPSDLARELQQLHDLVVSARAKP